MIFNYYGQSTIFLSTELHAGSPELFLNSWKLTALKSFSNDAGSDPSVLIFLFDTSFIAAGEARVLTAMFLYGNGTSNFANQ